MSYTSEFGNDFLRMNPCVFCWTPVDLSLRFWCWGCFFAFLLNLSLDELNEFALLLPFSVSDPFRLFVFFCFCFSAFTSQVCWSFFATKSPLMNSYLQNIWIMVFLYLLRHFDCLFSGSMAWFRVIECLNCKSALVKETQAASECAGGLKASYCQACFHNKKKKKN